MLALSISNRASQRGEGSRCRSYYPLRDPRIANVRAEYGGCEALAGGSPSRAGRDATSRGNGRGLEKKERKKGPRRFSFALLVRGYICIRTLRVVWGKDTEWITGEAPSKLDQRRKKLHLAM